MSISMSKSNKEGFIKSVVNCAMNNSDGDKIITCVENTFSDYAKEVTENFVNKEKKKRKASPWNIAVKHCAKEVFKDTPFRERMKKCSEWWKPLSQAEKDKIVSKYN